MASFKQVLGGLQILSKYVDVESLDQIDAQYDEIFVGGDNVSDDDEAKLKILGWCNTEYGWRKFT